MRVGSARYRLGLLPTLLAGTLTLPVGTQPVALTMSGSGRSAVVSLGPGHSSEVRVRVATSGATMRFSLPGRPADLSFVGRVTGRTVAGSVRQGAARGTFRLVASVRSSSDGVLGTYALDGGMIGLADYGRLGLPLWAIDYTTGAFHALHRAGAVLEAGPTVLAERPTVGRISVAGDRLTWTPNGGAPAAGTRIAIDQYEVRFPSGQAVLGGTLSIPRTSGTHPAVALVHGSGPALRDEGQFLAGLLLQHGIAVLAYDKRGNGQSTGRYPGETASEGNIDAYALDAEAAVRFLGSQPELDSARLGLLGGSQAGWIIPLAAARSQLVRFAIIQSGPTVTVGETADYSFFTSQGAAPLGLPLAEIEARVERDGPSGFDPKPSIRRLQIPVLWLFGGLDMNQPSNLDVQVLERLKHETGQDFSWRLYPHGNHGIFDVNTGLNAELATSPGMPAAFFADVRDWLRSHGLGT